MRPYGQKYSGSSGTIKTLIRAVKKYYRTIEQFEKTNVEKENKIIEYFDEQNIHS